MKTIDTYVHAVAVEIDGQAYQVAAKTIETAEKLMDAGRRLEGQPEYKLWLAEMEILLGKEAVKTIFPNGKKENLDRMYRICCGVRDAFEYNAEQVRSEKLEMEQEKISGLTELIKQIIAALQISENPGRTDIIRRK